MVRRSCSDGEKEAHCSRNNAANAIQNHVWLLTGCSDSDISINSRKGSLGFYTMSTYSSGPDIRQRLERRLRANRRHHCALTRNVKLPLVRWVSVDTARQFTL